ncbi:Transposon TX1 uncharacterized 149 kDa protein [Vitis vinifera]|uniref:Transposon TX1 uncharacterized 149 kDa protein n=1 Tax=Vitis vinifera TaxID=29760 RepID=A0A438GR00_VITVI|nr:Transposon TX1 uncharacterized 149 kDa protein [Vitis vinifera]
MWFKVEGFKDLLRSWWQGRVVRGSASFRLAAKMKELEQKFKVWNRDVFERLECNKALALQQVEFWDQLDQLSHQEAENLEIPFSEEEIHSALMVMNGDKAPSPDSFTMAFWQNCWDFVKEEVLEMFKEFHEQSSFIKSLNTTFLVLLPKKGGAEDLGDFRPISLLRGLYKLMAKILDASLIANKVIDSWQKDKRKGLICKLDIEKAYDSINWQFLMKVFFPSTKRLRQGDPLSPYLFVMGMEVLSALIRRAVEGGYLVGYKIWGGRRIKLAKSEIIPVGEVQELDVMAMEIGCRVGSLPSSYLGLPLGAPNKALSAWDGVEERVRRRLALWKCQYISKGGRITLIKSMMASMPIYQMSFFRIPKEVVCADKEKGGLGLKKLALLNKALLGKWIWRFACDKENLWKQNFGQGGWNLRLLRDFNDWELDLVGNLLHVLRGYRLTLEEDSVSWKGGSNEHFRVKEAYNLLVNPIDTVFPKNCIWVGRVPTKIAFFAWEATWGKVLILDRLQKRGWQIPNCCFCVVVKKKL